MRRFSLVVLHGLFSIGLALFGSISLAADLDELLETIYSQDIPKVEVLIQDGADLNEMRQDDGMWALPMAILSESPDMVDLLIRKGVDINLHAEGESAPIHYAVESDDLKILKRLLKAGVDINVLSVDGNSPLQIALNRDQLNMAQILVDQGADVNLVYIETPPSDDEVVPEEDPNDEDDWGGYDYDDSGSLEHPLFLALYLISEDREEDREQKQDQARALIDSIVAAGANLDIQDDEGNALIFTLLEKKDRALINALWASVKNKGVTDDFGNSILHKALKVGLQDIALKLAKSGARSQLADQIGALPMYTAYDRGFMDVVGEILGQEPGALPLNVMGSTLLHQAYADGNKSELQQWVVLAKDLNAVDINGDTLLHLAVRQGDNSLAAKLVAKNADLDVLNQANETPLLIALQSDNIDLANMLAKSSDKTVRFENGESLLHKAAQVSVGGIKIIERAFIDAGISTDLRDDRGLLPAHAAINFGRGEVLEYLVNQLAEPAYSTKTPNTKVFSSKLVEYWSLLYWAGERETLLSSVEKNLSSDHVNPVAPIIWVTVHDAQDNLEAKFKTQNGSWSGLVDVTADIQLLEDKSLFGEMVKKYPPSYGFKITDVFALNNLAGAAGKLQDESLKLDYLEAAIRLMPDFWQMAWSYEYVGLMNSPEYRSRAQAFARSKGIDGTLSGQFIGAMASHRSWGQMARYHWVDKWLEANPKDTRALTAKAYVLKNQHHYADALVYIQKALVIFPFYSNSNLVSELLVRQDKFGQARAYTALVARWYVNPRNKEILGGRVGRTLGTVYNSAGDKGGARNYVSKAITQFPDQERLLRVMANLERGASRYSQEAELYQQIIGLEKTPKSSDYKSYIRALINSGDKGNGLAVAQQALANLSFVSESLFFEILKLAKTLERDDRVDEVYALAIAQFPKSFKLEKFGAEWLWHTNQKTQALDEVERLLALRPDNAGLISTWKEYSLVLNDKGDVIQSIRKNLNDSPWNKTWWTMLVSLAANGDSDALEIWREANQKNNDMMFASDEIIALHVGSRDFELAFDTIDRAFASLDKQQASQPAAVDNDAVHNFYLYALWTVEQMSKRERVSSEALDAATVRLKGFRDIKGNLVNYYRYQEGVYRARNDKEEAAKSLSNRAKLSRNSTSIYHTLVADYSGKLSKLEVQGFGYNMLLRNPYSETHLSSYLHKQLLWQGSPINALKAIDNAKKIGIAYGNTYEKRALNQLGDTLKLFESYRILGTKPGNSKRYINWFEAARNDALFKDRKQIIYDFTGGKSAVRIVLPNGEVVRREDHPIFGTVIRYQKGASFMDVGYTERGDLASVKDSSGQSVDLTYDQSAQITRMADNKDRIVNFAYNENGKPRIISIQGLGSIHVEYDSDDEITKIASEAGHKMALKVTQAFQSLLALNKRVENIYRMDRIPTLAQTDEVLEKLRIDLGEAHYGSNKNADAQLELASHLVDHITDNADFFDEAGGLLTELFERAESRGGKQDIGRGVAAITLWYRLFDQVKPSGLPIEDYKQWSRMRTWLAGVSFKNSKYKSVLTKLDKEPLVLLKDAKWLATTDLQNSGYWKRYGNEELYSKQLAGLEKQALLIRENGDIVMGTSKGLTVLRSGFWEWFGYDDGQSRFSHTATPSLLGTTSNILSLAETEDGVLWIGTASGLFALNADYDDTPARWHTKADGLPSPRINALRVDINSVYVGTAKGLSKLDSIESQQANRMDVSQSASIKDLVLLPSNNLFGEQVAAPILLTDGGIALLSGDSKTVISKNASHMAYNEGTGQLYWLDNNRFYMADFVPEGSYWTASEARFLGLKNDLLHSKQIHELSAWNVDGEGATLVVNSDLGINIFKDYNFQSMSVPFEVNRGGSQVGPKLSATSYNGDIVVATTDGIYAYQPSSVDQYAIGRIYDTLVDNSLGITFVATGSDIRYIEHDRVGSDVAPEIFSTVNAKIMRLDNDGNLITHDRDTILRFKRGEDRPQQLFSSDQSVEGDDWHGKLNDIFVASDNTIWVAAGSSVFRFQDGMEEPEEYNYFIDAGKFPSRSQMIYRVYEDLNGDIFAVASNETHLNHEGVNLSGGVMKWKNGAFTNEGKDGDWFVTAYTKINDDTAIVSTNGAFLREKNGLRESYETLKGSAYEEMNKKSSMIWLGQKGAKLGDKNTWLFPSAGGVVVYHQGQWFYPDRLNQLLIDDQALGQYGARTVHTVAADKKGNIYVGTDLGLLIYQSQGVASLLTDHHRGQVAFSDFDTQHEQEIHDVFLGNIDAGSTQGKLISKYHALQKEIAQLKQVGIDAPGGTALASEIRSSEAGDDGSNAARTQNLDTEKSKALIKKLKNRERSRQKLLANLERNHYGLYQMLKLDPREIGAMHKKLKPGQALVQYMPVEDKLLIQVVTDTGAVIREVDVSKALLERMSMEAAEILRTQVRFLDSFSGDSGDDNGESVFEFDGSIIEDLVVKDTHIEHLQWLYHHLIRPIENELDGKDQVFITPVGKLTYVPFSALIRQVKPKIEYAIDRYNIGILPSMYHFNLVMQQSTSFSEKGLFVSDPDGSLPGARREVTKITEGIDFESTVLEGEDASLDNVLSELSDARIIHFATHGVLKPDAPEDSYLLLADSYQFNVIDISLLDLEETELVVLSACDSGVGISGLEYATLARAFALAKVPSVVASFWEVDDKATQVFMTHLYKELEKEEMDHFLAMHNAKQQMISDGRTYGHPAAWASFEVFGKP